MPAIPVASYTAVAEGKVQTGLMDVEGYSAKKAWGAAIVDVPIARYWAAINDDPGKQTHGILGHVKVVDGPVCGSGRTVFQYLPVSLATDRWWVANISTNEPLSQRSGGRVREMRWESVDWDVSLDPEVASWASGGMSIGFTKGAWFLVDLDGARTLVEYYAWTDPGGRIPAGLASRFAAGSIGDTITKMGEIAKGSPGCPIR